MDARDASAIAWMYAGHCATRCGLKEHASRSSSRFGARVASLARRDGASKRGLTSSQDRDVWWLRRGRNVSSRARRAASDASTRFVAAWRRAASILLWASAVRAGRAFALAVTSGLRVVYPPYAIATTLEKDAGLAPEVSRGRGASAGPPASDSRWREGRVSDAARWRRRAWAVLAVVEQVARHSFEFSQTRQNAATGRLLLPRLDARARRDESRPGVLPFWKSIEGAADGCGLKLRRWRRRRRLRGEALRHFDGRPSLTSCRTRRAGLSWNRCPPRHGWRFYPTGTPSTRHSKDAVSARAASIV